LYDKTQAGATGVDADGLGEVDDSFRVVERLDGCEELTGLGEWSKGIHK